MPPGDGGVSPTLRVKLTHCQPTAGFGGNRPFDYNDRVMRDTARATHIKQPPLKEIVHLG